MLDRDTGFRVIFDMRLSMDHCGSNEMDKSGPNMARTSQDSNRRQVCEEERRQRR